MSLKNKSLNKIFIAGVNKVKELRKLKKKIKSFITNVLYNLNLLT